MPFLKNLTFHDMKRCTYVLKALLFIEEHRVVIVKETKASIDHASQKNHPGSTCGAWKTFSCNYESVGVRLPLAINV